MASVASAPVQAVNDDEEVLRRLEFLLLGAQPGELSLTSSIGTQVPIPELVQHLVYEIVSVLAQGRTVTVTPHRELLTTQQAAGILNISRPYLIQLLDRDELPYTRTGTHRRIRFDDLMDYKRRRDQRTEVGLRELARLSQEAGLYDLPISPASPDDA